MRTALVVVPAPRISRKAPGAQRARPRDWQWQMRNAVTSAHELAAALPLTEGEREAARRADAQGLPIAITPYYLALIDPGDPRCPIRLQCVPGLREEDTVLGDL